MDMKRNILRFAAVFGFLVLTYIDSIKYIFRKLMPLDALMIVLAKLAGIFLGKADNYTLRSILTICRLWPI